MFVRSALQLRDVCSPHFGCILLIAAAIGPSVFGQTTDEVVRTLAPHVLEWFPARPTLSVECTNRSQAKEPEFAPVCRGVSRELQRLGAQTGSGGAVLSVTASESAAGKLVVIRAVSGSGEKVAMSPWSLSPQTPQDGRRVMLDRTLLVESSTPVLDYAVLQDGTAIALLEPAAVTTYARTPAGWELTHRELLPVTKPIARDPRGRLMPISATALTAYLPGSVCTSEDLAMRPFNCTGADSGWSAAPGVPVRWVTGRNFLKSENGSAYTIAAVSPDRLLISTVEGAVRLQGVRGEQLATFAGLGSDIATVDAPCGPFAITTRAGDPADPDQITAMDVRNGRIEPASAALSLPGPVTALWPSEKSTEVHAVIRNSGTGAYEVSRIAINCIQ